jgi:hypothetical protein
MKKQNKYTSIKHSLSNDIMNVNCSIKTIERVLNESETYILNTLIGNVDGKEYFLIDSINDVKKSMLNIFYKLDEYTRENKLTR